MELTRDRSGFPLLRISTLRKYVGWLPVTKIQLELFLCETADNRFGPRWYDEILSLNPRIVASELRRQNYWRAFATGLLPLETGSYLRWLGDGYRLPTSNEWFDVFEYLDHQEPKRVDWRTEPLNLKPRVVDLLEAMDVYAGDSRPRSLAEQMLLVGGVMEWVAIQDSDLRWGGLGEIPPSFGGLLFDPREGVPHCPLHPERERISYFGLRPLLEEPS